MLNIFKGNKIHLLGLKKKWVPGREFNHLEKILHNLGFEISTSKFAFKTKVYLHDKYSLKNSFYHLLKNKVYFDYFHGNPYLNPEFTDLFNYIISNKNKYHKIRVTNDVIYRIFEKQGLKSKLKKIYLGVDNNIFKEININEKKEIRKKLKIPEDHVVIGSFQKDGEGWGEGLIPKLIKGPDIFIETVKQIKQKKLKIFILLLGPARGFVKKELKKLNVSFFHVYEKNYFDIKKYYNILDFYLICSREEGGPKSLLESMACGIPVITTPVGQAVDLVTNKLNGIITKNYSAKYLAENVLELMESKDLYNKIVIEGKKTALCNDYSKQNKLWEDFFND